MKPGAWAGVRAGGFAVVVAGVVAGSGYLPERLLVGPTPASPSASVVATPATHPVAEILLGCPGPETEGIAGVDPVPGEAVAILASSAPAPVLAGLPSLSGSGALSVRSQPSDAVVATTSTRGRLVSGTVAGRSTAEVSATGGLAGGVAAVQTGLRRDGDERGLQAIACQVPRSELWLLAGGGAATRRERLIVSNAGANALTVDIHVLGAAGPVPTPSGSRVAVPPHGRVGVLVDALAPGEPSPAIHVAASGGLVTALLEDSWIDGATGRGRDDIGPADGPGTEQVIPAAFLTGIGTLRIAVPGPDEAVVQARVIGTAGAAPLPTDGVVRIPGGTVRDVDLAGVASGGYAVQVRSDRPIVASVLLQRRPTPEGPSELAWAASTAPIPELAGTPILPGTTGKLMVVGTGGAWTATAFFVDANGEVTSVPVNAAADTAWVRDLPANAVAVWVRAGAGTGSVRAGVLAETSDAGGPLVTVLPLSPISLSMTDRPVREIRR